MPVHDARDLPAADRRTLAPTASSCSTDRWRGPDIDFFDHEQVVRAYYPAVARIVREERAGRAVVTAFDHNVRSASGKPSKHRIEGGQQVQGPAHVVHGDYTLTSAPQRLRDLTRPPGEQRHPARGAGRGRGPARRGRRRAGARRPGRFAIINLWRNIAAEPVATHPLALCDAARVRPEDLVVFEIHYTTASARTISPSTPTGTSGTSTRR